MIGDKLIIFLDAVGNSEKDKIMFECGYMGQIKLLSSYFKEIIIYAPLTKDKIKLSSDSFSLSKKFFTFKHYDIEYKLGLFHFLKNFIFYYNSMDDIIKSHSSSNTIFTTYIPGAFLGLLSAYLIKKNKVKHFFRVTSNLSDEFEKRGNKIYRKIIGKIISPFVDFSISKLIGRSLTFYSGKIIYKNKKNQYKIISSSFFDKDIKLRFDTCQNDVINLLYVGRFDAKKGVPYLIDAFEKLINSHNNIKLTLVGGLGEQKEVVENMIKNPKIKNKIKYKGIIPFGNKLFEEYRSADIFIIPSLEDMQGKTQLEAMALGTPVIASDVGGIPETIKHLNNGILVAPANYVEISSAIELIISNELLRKKLIKNGFEFVKTCTLEKQNGFMIDIIKNKLL
jgi:glycosyltransferase involved in cell wall biosynthesis